MTEPLLPLPDQPTLPSMLDLVRRLAVLLAEYRVGAQVTPSEAPTVETCEVAARGIVDDLKTLISARTNAAKLT